jgi:hypothetical protein
LNLQIAEWYVIGNPDLDSHLFLNRKELSGKIAFQMRLSGYDSWDAKIEMLAAIFQVTFVKYLLINYL